MKKQIIYSVEDDESLRQLISYAVKNEGYDIESFENAEDLLLALDKNLPQLILLDIMLPKMDGIEALKIIRQKYKNVNIKIIMLTAKNSEIAKVTGLDSGADDYVTKPFSVLELIARIKANLRKYTVDTDDDELQFLGIKLNLKTRIVKIDNTEISLTLKEFDLLKLLMQNTNTVIEREKIITEIWGYEFFGETRTVDIHIKNLRAKFGKYADCIMSVRGVGYSLKEITL